MTTSRPRRVDGLEAHEVEDGLVVYHPATDRVHYLNPTASVVYELCTGEHTDAEIEALVGEAWALREPPGEEVQRCLAQLRDEGVIA
jgi:Coenzyme PQQ synthesis protein D (PqqD)